MLKGELVENGKVILEMRDGVENNTYMGRFFHQGRSYINGFKKCLYHLDLLGVFITEELPDGISCHDVTNNM